jgi:CDP-glucose 4,6-dehydratase
MRGHRRIDSQFWTGKKVFITGHTGFKGGWLTIWLQSMGASVIGYSLAPKTDPNFFDVTQVNRLCTQSYIDDVRELDRLRYALIESKPEVVIHMAAQPLVRLSYDDPVETYSTNVMGTVNLLEAIRSVESVRAVVIVTTDKCYENKEWVWGYRENDSVGGRDPYSSSKSCVELVTAAYCQSFFSEKNYLKHGVAIASARAGNVIGGGDWSMDRLIPDAINAFEENRPLEIRNPLATRPWQHVLEPLSGYLQLAQGLYKEGVRFGGAWNFGPRDEDTMCVEEVINILIKKWGLPATWIQDVGAQPHEAQSLKLDCSKARECLGWVPKWSLDQAIEQTVHWHQAYKNHSNMRVDSLKQINLYQQT